MLNYNELFFEGEEAFVYLKDIDDMNDLDDYMCGFHRIAISMTNEKIKGEKVIKVCFGDLLDKDKLSEALNSYFSQ